jgi:FKBP-type peptidyl-prolyl cis-trans isomerase
MIFDMKKILKDPLFLGLVFIIGITVFFTNCKEKDNFYELDQTAKGVLDKYIKDSNITVEPKLSGLYYIEKVAGTGEKARSGYKAYVWYTGYFLNGTEFDSNVDSLTPFDFTVGSYGVISGWSEGVSYMREGGKARLIIPYNLAYGTEGKGTIPGYTPLIFDIELLKVADFK